MGPECLTFYFLEMLSQVKQETLFLLKYKEIALFVATLFTSHLHNVMRNQGEENEETNQFSFSCYLLSSARNSFEKEFHRTTTELRCFTRVEILLYIFVFRHKKGLLSVKKRVFHFNYESGRKFIHFILAQYKRKQMNKETTKGVKHEEYM